MDIDTSLQEAPIMDRNGYPYLIHPLTDGVPRCDPRLLIEFAEWAGAECQALGGTVLLTPEAMGIPLAAATSMKTGLPYLVIRKRQYELEGEVLAYCETGYGESCLYINGLRQSDKIVIVDDVISTGGTLSAIVETLHAEGYTVSGVLSFIDKAGKAQELSTRLKIPVRAMRNIDVQSGRVKLVE